jgi:DNA-binding Lrp family transcriptional regulator
MITAIVMIKCEIGKVNSVAEGLVNLDGVAEVYSVSGEHDLMCIIRVKEYDAMAATVADDIARLKGIAKTTTHMAFRCYSKHNMEKVWGELLGE